MQFGKMLDRAATRPGLPSSYSCLQLPGKAARSAAGSKEEVLCLPEKAARISTTNLHGYSSQVPFKLAELPTTQCQLVTFCRAQPRAIWASFFAEEELPAMKPPQLLQRGSCLNDGPPPPLVSAAQACVASWCQPWSTARMQLAKRNGNWAHVGWPEDTAIAREQVRFSNFTAIFICLSAARRDQRK